jgi:membrane-associated phospholipid phosphatase
MVNRTAFRNWLFAFAATVVAVVVCVAYVDRFVAEFLERHFRHTLAWGWLSRALAPLDVVVVVALLFLLGCGTWVMSGGRLPRWTQTPLLCSWAAMWATAADIVFKRIFGRAWPDPTYVENHLYGFHLLHAGPHWDSFPSGTAAISAAIMSVLWAATRRWRAVTVLLVILVCIAVVIANYHWVADVIGGAFLGVSIGWMTVRLDHAARQSI